MFVCRFPDAKAPKAATVTALALFPPRRPGILLLQWIDIRHPAYLVLTNISNYITKNRSYFSRRLYVRSK
jgi:hypothetical protein